MFHNSFGSWHRERRQANPKVCLFYIILDVYGISFFFLFNIKTKPHLILLSGSSQGIFLAQLPTGQASAVRDIPFLLVSPQAAQY